MCVCVCVCVYIILFYGDNWGYYGIPWNTMGQRSVSMNNNMIRICLRIEYSENNWLIIIVPLEISNLQQKTGTPHSWTNTSGMFRSLELAIQIEDGSK